MSKTEQKLEMHREAEEKNLLKMARVQHCLEMWQARQNLCGPQKESPTQIKQLTPIEYIFDTEEIIKAFWSMIPHCCVGIFKDSELSPLPPALSAKDLPGGQTEQ